MARFRLYLINGSGNRIVNRSSSLHETPQEFAKRQEDDYNRTPVAWEPVDKEFNDEALCYDEGMVGAAAIYHIRQGRGFAMTEAGVRAFVRDNTYVNTRDLNAMIEMVADQWLEHELKMPATSAPTKVGPRKPPPALPVEVHNPRPVDAARAWAEVIAACKGSGSC